MIVIDRVAVKILLLLVIVLVTDARELSTQKDRLKRGTKDCNVDCSRAKPRPVCGTDKQTYTHKCELKRIRRCEGRKVRNLVSDLSYWAHPI